MRTGEAWVSIATTDRPEAFAALCHDLAQQAAEAEVELRLLVVENSRTATSRSANHDTLAGLRRPGVGVIVDDLSAGGCTTAASRLRQRELVRQTLGEHGSPQFVWMLDDDVRLRHAVGADGLLVTTRLHNHLAFLRDLRPKMPNLGVLIGAVTGDPPIPPAATLATRFMDLEANLQRMFVSDPAARWETRPATISLLREPDMYYDFSVERAEASWSRPACWFSRRGYVTVAEACVDMLDDAAHLPIGIGFTRPILAEPTQFDTLVDGTRRGANAVFFDVTACLAHDYPSVIVSQVETRRSDMIGTRLLAQSRSGCVKASQFSVLHQRPRSQKWPSAEEVVKTLVADALGAVLAREVDRCLSGVGVNAETFVLARIERMRTAATVVARVISRVADTLSRAPSWAGTAVGGVYDVLEWAVRCMPGARDGVLPESLAWPLTSRKIREELTEHAHALARGVLS